MLTRSALLLGLLALGCTGGAGNHPPAFLTIHPQSYEVGVAHEPLQVTATDEDGDPLSFSLTVTLFVDTDQAAQFTWKRPGDPLPPAMTFISEPDRGLLSWDPLASQVGTHEVTFTVSDGRDTDQEKVTIEVRSSGDTGGGAPLFVTPSSYVLQLVQTDTITATIAVQDEDSARVTLALEGAPQGMSFKGVGEDGKRGEFSWRPTQPQIEAKPIYGFTVTATDEDGNRAEQQLRIVIRRKDGGGTQPDCPGDPPAIHHTPLRDQFGAGSYPLSAKVTDDGRIQRVFAAFTTGDPQDLNSFQGAELQAVQDAGGGSHYEGALPNLTAAGGADLTYHYYLCALDDDDPQGDTCDHFWCVPEESVFTFVAHASGQQASCADDAREPNDTAQQAMPVDPGVLPDLWLCPQDEDWFALQGREGATLQAALAFADPATGSASGFALELQDAGGTALARTAEGADPLALTFELPADGTYLLRVTGQLAAGSDGVGYQLSTTLTGGGGSCVPDPGEPNEDLAQATPLPSGSSGPYTVCAGDLDVYSFAVQQGDQVDVRVLFDHRDGDLDAGLVDQGGVTLASAATAGDNEQLLLRAPAAGTLFLVVYGFDLASNSYQLELSVGGGAACSDSALEPNETPEQATPLADSVDAAICNRGAQDDVDFYRIDLPAFTGLRLHATFAVATGDLDMMLLDGEGRLLGLSETTQDDEEIQLPGLFVGGTVFVQIYGYQHAENRYRLAATRSPFDAQQCLPDLAEPDDDADHAVAAPFDDQGALLQPGLSLCGNDQDWYALDLPQGQTLLAGIRFALDRGLLDVVLYRGAVAVDRDERDVGTKTVTAEEAGRYLLQVIGRDGAAANLYTLEAMVQ